jgi:hypothetical protein
MTHKELREENELQNKALKIKRGEIQRLQKERKEMIDCFHEIFKKSDTAGYHLSKESRTKIKEWWKPS